MHMTALKLPIRLNQPKCSTKMQNDTHFPPTPNPEPTRTWDPNTVVTTSALDTDWTVRWPTCAALAAWTPFKASSVRFCQ
jgi:hypothetical protein